MQHTFDTPRPVEIYVEFGRGRLVATGTDTTQSVVSINGKNADDVTVEQDGETITVIAPRERIGFLNLTEASLEIEVTVPSGSRLATKTGSADQLARGSFERVSLKSGSGDIDVEQVTADAAVSTGSGDVDIREVGGELLVKSGSGDVTVAQALGSSAVSTGSGDIRFERADGAAVLKTGSGDVAIAVAGSDVSAHTASGDVIVRQLRRGKVVAKNATGDISLGVPPGIPVWTDINTVTGSVRSDLVGAGQPTDGQDHIELRVTSVSGDVALKQL